MARGTKAKDADWDDRQHSYLNGATVTEELQLAARRCVERREPDPEVRTMILEQLGIVDYKRKPMR